MTPDQVKDLIACYLSQHGLNHDSIIAILCNIRAESGFVPLVHEYSGGGGFGLFQWTGNADGLKARAYAAGGHSEEENVKFQLDIMLNNPGQWSPIAPYSFDDFLHNKPNRSAEQLTVDFTRYWERPAYVGNRYAQFYSGIQPIQFCGSSAPTQQKDDKPDKKQKFGIGACTPTTGKDGDNPEPPKPGGDNADWNPQPLLDYYNKYHGSLYYSMGARGLVTQGIASDCSAFVSYMLSLCYPDMQFGLYNTESLHGYLKENGFHLQEETGGTHLNGPFKGGDVLILGLIGTSMGASGHTLIFADSDNIYDCNGTDNGLGHKLTANLDQYFAACASFWYGTWHVYHYTRS